MDQAKHRSLFRQVTSSDSAGRDNVRPHATQDACGGEEVNRDKRRQTIALWHNHRLAERIGAGLVVNAERMRTNLEALQGLVFSERLARVIARDTDRSSALALVDDWSAVAVAERRNLRDVALAARPAPAGQLDEVFSLEAIVRELTPVLDETLDGIPGDG